MVMLFSIGLAVAAYVGQALVRDSGERNSRSTAQAARLLSALDDSSRHLDQLNSDLLTFAIDPGLTGRAQLKESGRALATTIARLKRFLDAVPSGSLAELQRLLRADTEQLIKLTDELIEIRLANERWVPASRLMTEHLVPLNSNLRGQIQSLDQALSDTGEYKGIRLELAQLQTQWLSLVGELRLMVANRFGVFDTNSEAAMDSRFQNMSHFSEEARTILAKVSAQLRQADDEILLHEHQQVEQMFLQWLNAAQQLRLLLAKDNWRRDSHFLHHAIDPLMATMHQRIGAMRLEVQTEMQKLLNSAQNNSAALASAISWTTGAILLLFVMGYLAFEFWLLRPIEHIAKQLKQEAQGTVTDSSRKAPVAETRALIEAFEEMHQQVQARQQRLDFMAHHDPLTGLPNRVMFRSQIDSTLKRLVGDRHIALLFLDLDRFKTINDSHGHLVGDKVLVQVAQRLRSVFREEDTVARLSGDEFAVLLHDFKGKRELERLAEKVVQTFKPPFEIDGNTYHSSASIGLTVASANNINADTLIQQADAAMYHAKASGRSRYSHFEQDMVEQSTAQLTLETDLHSSIESEQLEIFLQPVVDMRDNRLYASESLLRWRHPKRGLLAPEEFLHTLKDIGMLQRITEIMLDKLADEGITKTQQISINLPAALLGNEQFTQGMLKRIDAKRLAPEHLIIEITEDSFSTELGSATPSLLALQQKGVRIALDDFGTGHSSLSQLRNFNFDIIKIDRSFVGDIGSDPQAADLTKAIITLARSLKVQIVSEGVETEQQRLFLLEQGCLYGQGYLFGQPQRMSTSPSKDSPKRAV